ncbi:NADH ubiquinone oxidoreductase 20 kDa subunit, partial [mine drainage metagenome]
MMANILNEILRHGVRSEPFSWPQADLETWQQALWQRFGRALVIRHVDAGSCNGCELEIHALNAPQYNLTGLGLHFSASPRHADLLLVTGPVSRHMEEALRRTYAALPEPRWVVAV